MGSTEKILAILRAIADPYGRATISVQDMCDAADVTRWEYGEALNSLYPEHIAHTFGNTVWMAGSDPESFVGNLKKLLDA